MSEVTIKLANVGGLEKFEASVDLGAVSVIRGAAASGKSSILRGALLALVGTTYNSGNALKTEAESLRIHDTGEDGLLRVDGVGLVEADDVKRLFRNSPGTTVTLVDPSTGRPVDRSTYRGNCGIILGSCWDHFGIENLFGP